MDLGSCVQANSNANIPNKRIALLEGMLVLQKDMVQRLGVIYKEHRFPEEAVELGYAPI